MGCPLGYQRRVLMSMTREARSSEPRTRRGVGFPFGLHWASHQPHTPTHMLPHPYLTQTQFNPTPTQLQPNPKPTQNQPNPTQPTPVQLDPTHSSPFQPSPAQPNLTHLMALSFSLTRGGAVIRGGRSRRGLRRGAVRNRPSILSRPSAALPPVLPPPLGGKRL